MAFRIGKNVSPVGMINVKEFGAKGDGSTNDYAAISSAINLLTTLGGGILYFPKGTYLVGTSLTLPSNVTVQGEHRNLVTIRDHSTLGVNRLFYIVGTSGTPIKNIAFKGITFRNGTASTTVAQTGRDGIRTDYVDGLIIEDCQFTEIQGFYGVVSKFTKNIISQRNIFYRCTYACQSILAECENIRILDNVFDTLTQTGHSVSYTLHTGNEGYDSATANFFLKNLWVERNVFKNNPRWEGIDCHGGENIWIRNNYVENCKTGIMVGMNTGDASPPTQKFVANPVLKNVVIENNRVIQGNGLDDQAGIVVTGEPGYEAEQIVIRNNKVTGFGGSPAFIMGSITVYHAKRIIIEDNEVDQYRDFGICLYSNLTDVITTKNKIKDMRSTGTTISAAITVRSFGVSGAVIRDNVSEPTSIATAPHHLIYTSSTVKYSRCDIRNNKVTHFVTAQYGAVGNLPVDKDTMPTTMVFTAGDELIGTDSRVSFVCTSPKVGFGSLSTDTIATAAGTAGSNTITVSSVSDFYNLCEGMNITIPGAGTAGADLNAKVLKTSVNNDPLKIVLDVNVITTVAAAAVKYQLAVLKPVGDHVVTSLPTATSLNRGRVVRIEGATGVADSVYVCVKKADDTYDWAQLF